MVCSPAQKSPPRPIFVPVASVSLCTLFGIHVIYGYFCPYPQNSKSSFPIIHWALGDTLVIAFSIFFVSPWKVFIFLDRLEQFSAGPGAPCSLTGNSELFYTTAWLSTWFWLVKRLRWGDLLSGLQDVKLFTCKIIKAPTRELNISLPTMQIHWIPWKLSGSQSAAPGATIL